MERELILSKLTMEQVVQFYTPRKITKHRCACPIHNGSDDNFVLYNSSFYCWVCGSAGDFIKFVSLIFNISYADAMKKIDEDFALAVFQQPTLTQHRKNLKAVQQFRAKEQREQEERDRRFREYRANLIELDKYKSYIQLYKPSPGDEELHPLFAEALHKIPYIEHCLDHYDWR